MKSVLKPGNSLAIPLTKELKKIGINRPKEKVWVEEIQTNNNKVLCLLISKDKEELDKKIIFLDKSIWRDFYLLAKENYNNSINEVIEGLFISFIDKHKSFLKKPVLKIKF